MQLPLALLATDIKVANVWLDSNRPSAQNSDLFCGFCTLGSSTFIQYSVRRGTVQYMNIVSEYVIQLNNSLHA